MTDLRAVRDRWASSLQAGEEQDAAEGAQFEREVTRANAWRAGHGIAALVEEEHPELEFHQRARALGLG